MKTFVSAISLAWMVVACGGGSPGTEGLDKGSSSSLVTVNGKRQAVLNACGLSTDAAASYCGVELPTGGADQNAQSWENAAGCIADHPAHFSSACKSLFGASCGASGDGCVCNDGQVLDDDGSCVAGAPPTCPRGQVLVDGECAPPGSCDNDLECLVPHGLGQCSSHVENDPPTGRCSVASCERGYVVSKDKTACVSASPVQCLSGADLETAATYTVCSSGATVAWISSTNGGGKYHSLQICRTLGYTGVGQFGGTCGNVCGFCEAPTSCSVHGRETFDGAGAQPADAFGPVLAFTVTWQCTR